MNEIPIYQFFSPSRLPSKLFIKYFSVNGTSPWSYLFMASRVPIV